MTLYHLTCEHGRRGIGWVGRIRPNVQGAHATVIGVPVVWLTSDWDVPPDALGLTSTTLSCVRTGFVYEVSVHRAVRWLDHPLRTEHVAAALEGPQRRPELWWVTTEPVRGRLLRVRVAS